MRSLPERLLVCFHLTVVPGGWTGAPNYRAFEVEVVPFSSD